MAYHFSANQFEDQYGAKKLGNWEYPKWFPERPRQRFKKTQVIADNIGHLLPGYKGENPWGNFVGTWDMPRRITREYVNKLVAPPERLVKIWRKKSVESTEAAEQSGQKEKGENLPLIQPNPESSAGKSFQRRNKSCSALDLRPKSCKLIPLNVLKEKKENSQNIKPGTLDENIKNILDSVKDKEEKPIENPEFVCKEIKALPRNLESTDEKTDLDKVQEEIPEDNMVKPIQTPELEPLKNDYSAFQIAKRFHEENLRHKPLPDVIDDPVFKALNSQRHQNPGSALCVNSLPSAIGWKPYSAPRPTDCSKVKVFRPKTGIQTDKPHTDSRPKTGDSTCKKKYLPIELAICWDFKPSDPSQEPKRSPHIDGSNGSAAPAVFAMIKPGETDRSEENIAGTPQALVERISKGIESNNAATVPSQVNNKTVTPLPVTNKEAILTYIKPPKEEPQKQEAGTPESLNSISPNAADYARRHPKTAWTKEDTSKVLSDRLQNLQNEKTKKNSVSPGSGQLKKKHYQSTPNLTTVCDGSHCGTEKSSPASSKNSEIVKTRKCSSANVLGGSPEDKTVSSKKKNCSACKKSNSDCSETREKPEFKSAFKAGVPRSESTNSGSSSAAKSYKVPKMRLPYAKRSYSIGTLAPPFSLWRENKGQDYPEHWRLASVYQHSYKPINSRKRPLLASVYQ